jgi:two-component system response regulator AtoC
MLREALVSHDWPGNIRELENVIRKLLVVRRADYVAGEIQNRARRRNVALRIDSAPNGLPIELVTSLPKLVSFPVPEAPPAAHPASFQPFLPSVTADTRSNGNIHEDLSPTRDSGLYRNGGDTFTAGAIEEVDRWSVLDRVDHARREAETEAIIAALNSTLWNRKRAAEVLNIDYKALLYKMKKLGIVERAAKIAI